MQGPSNNFTKFTEQPESEEVCAGKPRKPHGETEKLAIIEISRKADIRLQVCMKIKRQSTRYIIMIVTYCFQLDFLLLSLI